MHDRTIQLRARPRDTADTADTAGTANAPVTGKPRVAACISGGGFRSYSAALGQFRALHALGLASELDLLSGVSGGAWFASAYLLQDMSDVDRLLGTYIPPEQLTNAALFDAPVPSLAAPVCRMSMVRRALELSREGVPPGELFGEALYQDFLAPLGLERCFATMESEEQRADFIERNPSMRECRLVVPAKDRPAFVAGASVGFSRGEVDGFLPVEIGWGHTVLPPQISSDIGDVETIALASDIGPSKPGLFEATPSARGFSLPELWVATGGAPMGVLVKLARALDRPVWDLVPHLGDWLGKDAYLVDGAYVDNTGVLAALRRGASNLLVFVNQQSDFGAVSPRHVDGFEGQVAHLFGKRPLLGIYASSSAHVFPESELNELKLDFQIAASIGELPWSLTTHQIRADNGLGIEARPVKILWVLNQTPRAWMDALPTETKLVWSAAGLVRHTPHMRAAYADPRHMFRLHPEQVNATAHLHDYSLRQRKKELDALLRWTPRDA